VCKSADLLLMVLDATKPWGHKEILTRELESVGIRINKCVRACACACACAFACVYIMHVCVRTQRASASLTGVLSPPPSQALPNACSTANTGAAQAQK